MEEPETATRIKNDPDKEAMPNNKDDICMTRPNHGYFASIIKIIQCIIFMVSTHVGTRTRIFIWRSSEGSTFVGRFKKILLKVTGLKRYVHPLHKLVKEMAVPLHQTMCQVGQELTSHFDNGIYHLISGDFLNTRLVKNPHTITVKNPHTITVTVINTGAILNIATDDADTFTHDAIESIKVCRLQDEDTTTIINGGYVISNQRPEIILVLQNFQNDVIDFEELHHQADECKVQMQRTDMSKNVVENFKFSERSGEGPTFIGRSFLHDVTGLKPYVHPLHKLVKEMAVLLHQTSCLDGQELTSHFDNGIYQLISEVFLNIRLIKDPNTSAVTVINTGAILCIATNDADTSTHDTIESIKVCRLQDKDTTTVFSGGDVISTENPKLSFGMQNFQNEVIDFEELHHQADEYMSKNFVENFKFSDVRRENRKVKDVKRSGEGPTFIGRSILHDVTGLKPYVDQQSRLVKEMAVLLHQTMCQDGQELASHFAVGIYLLISGFYFLSIQLINNPKTKYKPGRMTGTAANDTDDRLYR